LGAQTAPDKQIIELIQLLKEKYHLKIAVINNEARELNDYRINKFHLNQFVDIARNRGIRSITHIDYTSTSAELASCGLSPE